MEFIKKFGRELLILILFVALAYFLGRGYESRLIANLIIENQALQTMKLNTEALINRGAPPQTQQIFQQLGYNVTVTQPQEEPAP